MMSEVCELCQLASTNEESALVVHSIRNRQTGEQIGEEVCHWPVRMRAEAEFLKSANPTFVEYAGDSVTFRVMNGQATYTVENPYTNIGVLNLTLGKHELRPRMTTRVTS